MSKNLAAYLVSKKKIPLEVKSAPYTTPGPNEIVIQNGAVAINPLGTQISRLSPHCPEYDRSLSE